MTKIRCIDLGADCPYEAKGADKKVVKAEFMKHAMEYHSDMLGGMTEEEKENMMKQVDEIIGL